MAWELHDEVLLEELCWFTQLLRIDDDLHICPEMTGRNATEIAILVEVTDKAPGHTMPWSIHSKQLFHPIRSMSQEYSATNCPEKNLSSPLCYGKVKTALASKAKMFTSLQAGLERVTYTEFTAPTNRG
jgi:hypothetical protein